MHAFIGFLLVVQDDPVLVLAYSGKISRVPTCVHLVLGRLHAVPIGVPTAIVACSLGGSVPL